MRLIKVESSDTQDCNVEGILNDPEQIFTAGSAIITTVSMY